MMKICAVLSANAEEFENKKMDADMVKSSVKAGDHVIFTGVKSPDDAGESPSNLGSPRGA